MFTRPSDAEFTRQRNDLVDSLKDGGIHDERVLNAIKTVPRHEFVTRKHLHEAYGDYPLPIGERQTISQPTVVAHMAELADIHETDVVLEVGSGCGYNAAVLSRLAYKVYSTEIIPELHKMAKENIERIGYDNVELILGNGSIGYAEQAPYDAIVVTCSAPSVPTQLKDQLAEGGRMIIPVFKPHRGCDRLTKVTRISDTEYREELLTEVQFVPLTGKEGHKEDPTMQRILGMLLRHGQHEDNQSDEDSDFA